MARGRGSSKDTQAVKPAAATPKARFELLLENIEQQNRAVMEALHAQGNQLRQEMREGFDKLATRADVHEVILRQHSADIQELKAAVEGLGTKVERLGTKVERLETKVEGLETKVEGLETKVEGLETKVEGLETKVEKLDGAVGRIELKLDVKADVSQVKGLEARVTVLEGQ